MTDLAFFSTISHAMHLEVSDHPLVSDIVIQTPFGLGTMRPFHALGEEVHDHGRTPLEICIELESPVLRAFGEAAHPREVVDLDGASYWHSESDAEIFCRSSARTLHVYIYLIYKVLLR